MTAKSADPRSGVLEHLLLRGEVSSPLPPSALGVLRRPLVQVALKGAKLRKGMVKAKNLCHAKSWVIFGSICRILRFLREYLVQVGLNALQAFVSTTRGPEGQSLGQVGLNKP